MKKKWSEHFRDTFHFWIFYQYESFARNETNDNQESWGITSHPIWRNFSAVIFAIWPFRWINADSLFLITRFSLFNCTQYTSLAMVWLTGKSSKWRLPLQFHQTISLFSHASLTLLWCVFYPINVTSPYSGALIFHLRSQFAPEKKKRLWRDRSELQIVNLLWLFLVNSCGTHFSNFWTLLGDHNWLQMILCEQFSAVANSCCVIWEFWTKRAANNFLNV